MSRKRKQGGSGIGGSEGRGGGVGPGFGNTGDQSGERQESVICILIRSKIFKDICKMYLGSLILGPGYCHVVEWSFTYRSHQR
jgi:hypothetical protein